MAVTFIFYCTLCRACVGSVPGVRMGSVPEWVMVVVNGVLGLGRGGVVNVWMIR